MGLIFNAHFTRAATRVGVKNELYISPHLFRRLTIPQNTRDIPTPKASHPTEQPIGPEPCHSPAPPEPFTPPPPSSSDVMFMLKSEQKFMVNIIEC